MLYLLREPGETPLKRSHFHGPSPTVVVGPGCEDEAVDERVVIFMTYRTSCNCWLPAMGHGAFVRSSREKHNPDLEQQKSKVMFYHIWMEETDCKYEPMKP